MGNVESSSGNNHSSSNNNSNNNNHDHHHKSRRSSQNDVASRARNAVGQLQAEITRQFEDDNPVSQVVDTLCGHFHSSDTRRTRKMRSYYSEDMEDEDDSDEEDEETTYTDYRDRKLHHQRKYYRSNDSASYVSDDLDGTTVDQSTLADSRGPPQRHHHGSEHSSGYSEDYCSHDDGDTYTHDQSTRGGTITCASTNEDENTSFQIDPKHHHTGGKVDLSKQPLASSFAKRCYFTKAGIGMHTQHYEGLTLSGNVVLMLAAAMKLKGCPTICDEDLRRVEQTYPNQFSRLPDELLLSSGWRRISKYCHFSNKPIPDGVPFFHSKQRLHPSGGYYFLLAAAVGMVRPIDVEPLNRDTLVLLETDFPTQCDAAPAILIQDPSQWVLVDKFCFFSGGPINTDEDVYYQADFDGNPIYMLAFLSPSLTPAELYKLDAPDDQALQTRAAVEEVESVYDLTDRDFDDLKLYHLGPCRALPQYILQPLAWTKVLPPHFLAARELALRRAQDYDNSYDDGSQQRYHSKAGSVVDEDYVASNGSNFNTEEADRQRQYELQMYNQQQQMFGEHMEQPASPYGDDQHQITEEEPYDSGYPPHQSSEFIHHQSILQHERGPTIMDHTLPMDEAIAAVSHFRSGPPAPLAAPMRMDPPEDEPPSLSKRGYYGGHSVSSADYSSQRSSYKDGESFQGSAYQDAAYQDGLAYGGSEYYHEEERLRRRNENAHLGTYSLQRNDDAYYGDHHLVERAPSEEDNASRGLDNVDGFNEAHIQAEDQFNYNTKYHNNSSQEEFHPSDHFQHGNDNLEPSDEYYDDFQASFVQQPQNYDSQLMEHGHYDPPVDEFNSPMSETDSMPFSDPDFEVPDDEFENFGLESKESNDDYSPRRRNPELPPPSPRSPQESELSQSSAMRGAQELLRRNRQRRLEMARRARDLQRMEYAQHSTEAEDESTEPTVDLPTPRSQETGGTWDSNSDFTTSQMSGEGSSVWTDDNPDRSSRRALILQMAKARMKSHGVNKQSQFDEEKKLESTPEMIASTNDIDLTGDLD